MHGLLRLILFLLDLIIKSKNIVNSRSRVLNLLCIASELFAQLISSKGMPEVSADLENIFFCDFIDVHEVLKASRDAHNQVSSVLIGHVVSEFFNPFQVSLEE